MHRNARLALMAAGVLVAASAVGTTALAGGDHSNDQKVFVEKLTGYEEDPMALSTTGSGRFSIRINDKKQEITYQLSYGALEGTVTQSHIHFGGKAQSGGISTFLCSNLGNGPAGTQACPAAPATISGTIRAADVIGPTAQGITTGQFDELVKAIRAGATYANVHSTLYPGGEIRGQLDHH